MQPETRLDEPVQLICGTCQKPISGKARSDVTRFLANESRCVCPVESEAVADAQPVAMTGAAEPSISREEVQSNLGDRYEVLELIGQGGMGVVYKVRDLRLDKIFAIKVLNRNLVQDNNSVKRFEQEAQSASNLTHANLGAVYEYGVGNKGAPFIVMDFLDGKNLSETLQQEGFLDAPRAVDIFIQITEAVVHAHMKGVIHRDIKPGNVILTKTSASGQDFAKLVDFGIAKVLPTQGAASKLTQTGEIFGSPQYMSPEQCLGNPLDARSDIYALGCVMYEALTNVPAFAAENPIKTILKQVNDAPTPFAKLKHSYAIPPGLEEVVMRCLEKEPGHRYQSAEEVLADLLRIREGKPIAVNLLKKPHPSDEGGSRRRKVFRFLTLALILCLVGAATFSWVRSSGITGSATLPTEGPHLTGQPHADADELDRWSAIYYQRGDYERAIPLLEFGIKTYKENGKHYGNQSQETVYLADNYNHLGKCYLALKQPAKAAEYYPIAIKLYNKFGDYAGSNFEEAVKDYATALRLLGRDAEGKSMLEEFRKTKRVLHIPRLETPKATSPLRAP